MTIRLTEDLALAFGKAFAAFTVRYDEARGVSQDPDHYDCVAVEESAIWSGFINEFFPHGDWERINQDPGYQVVRKTMYDEARAMAIELQIREEQRRLEWSDEDVRAMFPNLAGTELLEMLIGAEPAEEEAHEIEN